MKNEIVFMVALACMVLIAVAFLFGGMYKEYKENKQNELINTGVQSGFQQTAIEITRTGNIPVVVNDTIQWIPLVEICGG